MFSVCSGVHPYVRPVLERVSCPKRDSASNSITCFLSNPALLLAAYGWLTLDLARLQFNMCILIQVQTLPQPSLRTNLTRNPCCQPNLTPPFLPSLQACMGADAGATAAQDVHRLLPAAPPLQTQLAQAQAQVQGQYDDSGQACPTWADRFAGQWQRGGGGGGGGTAVAPWMQERMARQVGASVPLVASRACLSDGALLCSSAQLIRVWHQCSRMQAFLIRSEGAIRSQSECLTSTFPFCPGLNTPALWSASNLIRCSCPAIQSATSEVLRDGAGAMDAVPGAASSAGVQGRGASAV